MNSRLPKAAGRQEFIIKAKISEYTGKFNGNSI